MKRECPMPTRVFPLFLSILFVCFLRGNEFRAAGRRHGVHPRRARGTMPWNNAVRTRGVFTHRDDFQKPACVERGLVRTGPSWGTQLGRLELGHRSRAPEPGQPGLVRPIWCARQVNPDGRGWWTAKELQRPCVADNGNMESTSNCVRFRTRHIWLFEDRYSCFIILANSIL